MKYLKTKEVCSSFKIQDFLNKYWLIENLSVNNVYTAFTRATPLLRLEVKRPDFVTCDSLIPKRCLYRLYAGKEIRMCFSVNICSTRPSCVHLQILQLLLLRGNLGNENSNIIQIDLHARFAQLFSNRLIGKWRSPDFFIPRKLAVRPAIINSVHRLKTFFGTHSRFTNTPPLIIDDEFQSVLTHFAV